MIRSVWKIIDSFGLSQSPHLPDVEGLALAEVDALGVLRTINQVAERRWEWKKGKRVPSSMMSALQALSALDAVDRGAAHALPVQQGGLALVGVSLKPDRGWLIVGHSNRRQLVARASTFKSLIEKVPVLLMRMTLEGFVLEADDEAARITGYSANEILDRPFWEEVVHPEDRWKLTEALRVAKGGRKTAVTVRFLTPRQEIRLADLHLLPPPGKRITELQVLVFDVTKQHAVEAALLQSEALYRTFLEQSPMGVLHLDNLGVITFENHPFRQIVGERVEDAWIGRKIEEVTGLDANFRGKVVQMLTEGVPLRSASATYRKRPGEAPVHLVVHGSPIRQPGDIIVGGVLMVEDVTEQRRREDELKLRDRYEKAEANLRAAVLTDPDLSGTVFLQRAAAILGETTRSDRVQLLVQREGNGVCTTRAVWSSTVADRPVPFQIKAHAHPALSKGFGSRRSLYLHRDRISRINRTLLDLTGAAEAIWAPFFNTDEHAGGFVLLERTALLPDEGTRFWPINELNLINQLVRLFETLWAWVQVGHRYRLTISTIDDCLFTYAYTDGDLRRYLFITPQVEALTGYTAEGLLEAGRNGISWEEVLLDPDDVARLNDHDAALRKGEEHHLTFRVLHRDGSERWIMEHAYPVTDAMGHVTVSGILMDVTEQKQAEVMLRRAKEEAESQNRLKSAFVATMSHELRTPLGAIQGFSELLSHELAEWEEKVEDELPPEVHEFTEAVQENARKLLTLADNLFVLSNIEIGTMRVEQSPVLVNQLIREEAGKMTFPLSEKGIGLRVELDPANPVAMVDPTRFRQVVAELMRNAVKFTNEGLIQVRTQHVEGEVMVEVADTGVGIAEEHLPQLFTPFLQEDNRLNRNYEGTGLGLALVKRLTDLMQGRIVVESEKGFGATFRVFFPAEAGRGDGEDSTVKVQVATSSRASQKV